MSELKPTRLAASDRAASQPTEQSIQEQMPFSHAILVTGHMIDKADRAQPRFPAWAERRAGAAILASLTGLTFAQAGSTIGLAGAASGGDLLFNEVCAELGIPTRILLGLPVDEFLAASVAPAGPDWVRRFRALLTALGPQNRVAAPASALNEAGAGVPVLVSETWGAPFPRTPHPASPPPPSNSASAAR